MHRHSATQAWYEVGGWVLGDGKTRKDKRQKTTDTRSKAKDKSQDKRSPEREALLNQASPQTPRSCRGNFPGWDTENTHPHLRFIICRLKGAPMWSSVCPPKRIILFSAPEAQMATDLYSTSAWQSNKCWKCYFNPHHDHQTLSTKPFETTHCKPSAVQLAVGNSC